ncbi:MAG: ISKra4 family transposase [Boseongicola sp.]|nr:ISKra4 family transposase [Boseongicola sp.]
MKIEVRLRIDAGEGNVIDEEVLELDKPHDALERIGLSLDEAKELLGRLQERIVAAQAAAFVEDSRRCPCCSSRLWSKGRTSFLFRTPFGDVPVESTRLKHCRCGAAGSGTFSPLSDLFNSHVAPEMLYLETKWASLVSFETTVGLLKDVLPVGATLNAETVRNHLHQVANRMEEELGDERVGFIEGAPRDHAALPPPEGPIVVGIDGGYVRSRERDPDGRLTNFEVLVGKSMAEDRDNRYFGLVRSLEEKPNRRLHEVLKEQGLQMNQEITFLNDGEDSIRGVAEFMSPCAEHVLDWFHVTMRVTVLRQHAKGLAGCHHDHEEAEEVDRALSRIKGFLWHGNIRAALPCIDDLAMDLECIETRYPSIKAFCKGVREFQTYIANNAHAIPNYAERHRYGERVSTAFVESTVNTVVGKRFSKKQQMRWSKSGAHLVLQTRTRVLDGTLRTRFQSWHPGLFNPANSNQAIDRMVA